MHSHLIVMTFDREGEAQRVHDALRRMRGSPRLGLENAAVVTKDRRDRLVVTQQRELSQTGTARDDDLTSSAIALLFGQPPEEVVEALAEEGFDLRLREQVVQALGDNGSALFILLTADSSFDRGRLLGILTLFQGTIYETTLPQGVEAALARGWET